MSEQAFTYEHYDNASYAFAGLALIGSLLVLMPLMATPVLITYLALSTLVFTYGFVRMVKFDRRNQSIPQKEQKQIIKRHKFSLNWLFLILAVSLFIPIVLNLFFELTLMQTIGAFNTANMFSAFVLLRLFLRRLKSRMNFAPLRS